MPASSFVNKDHAGSAVDTTIVSGINGTDLSITLVANTGWPSGGANGPFNIIVSYDLGGKEKIEVQSRTGSTLTIADTGKRGIDGTSAQSHLAGAKIRHCFTAGDAQEANDHITNVALDHHTQYHTAARHAAVVHTSAMLGTDSVGSDEIAAGAVASAELASAAVTAGKIGVGGISAANQFASGVVDAAAIATDAVGAAEIAALAVGTAELADLGVTSGKLAADSVIAGKIAAGAISQTADIADAVITLAKMFAEDPVSYAPSAGSFSSNNDLTLGTGGTSYGYYYKVGLLTVGWAGFSMAADGNVPAGSVIRIPVPFAQKSLTTMRGFTAARARTASGLGFSGTGLILAGNAFGQNIITAGDSVEWDATTPFNWGTPGVGVICTLDSVFFFVAAS